MSFLRFVLVAGAVSALAGCPQEPASKLCPGTGILCPEDMYCGAVQPICLTTACGNGLVDPGEECDDGNVMGGDTCSVICRKESCGNSVLDPGEVCDDGNQAAGDGCSPNCMSKEICGNGIVDVGEVCDDGATDPGSKTNADGCSGTSVTVGTEMSPAPCSSTEVCGNGIKDIQTGEVCDDGNTTSGDGCNSDCRSGEGCGNGFLDPLEQCDDGNANDNDDCLNSCKIAKCGDGVVDNMGTHGETCDPSTTGNPTETMTCNIDCTTRTCGDGKVNQTAGESCDNGVGNNADTKNCTAACALNVCGDGKVDMQDPVREQCDDGNQNNTDGCSNSCQLASCGNSTVDSGEQCDDGNTIDTDACVMCLNATCGDGKIRAGVEACDDGNLTNGDGCSATCRTEGCGNGILDPGEECDDGNAVNTDACVQGCKVAVCGDSFIRMGVEQCDDNNVLNGDGCSSNCRSEGCGNGQLDPGEACDDGNMANGDGCSSQCTFEGCGDGIVNNGEACDGNGAGQGGETATCNVDCTLRTCGDAKVNATAGEQCDNGTIMGVNQNANNRDCRADCKINICTDGFRNTLGPTRLEACDDGNQNNTDGCSNTCTLASCGNSLKDPGEQCDDGNTNNNDSCVNCMNAQCGDNFAEMGVEECDGAAVTVGGVTFSCTAACKLKRCGNGIIDVGEECDNDVKPAPMAGTSGDGCSSTCKIEFCGDGLTNNAPVVNGPHEECDVGTGTATAQNNLCNRNCTLASCGDGIVNSQHTVLNSEILGASGKAEQCDPPNVPGCNAYCRFENCGDNVLQAVEECDVVNGSPQYASGPAQAGHSCNQCKEVFCGNGEIEPGNPATSEECEPPNTKGCSAACKTILYCGDGLITAGEDCEPPNTATCTHNCKTSSCGDSIVNPLSTPNAETCDPGGGGTPNFTATCDNNCTAAACGDGTKNTMTVPPEQCDTGNANMGYDKACLPNCKDNVCGDGFVLMGTEPCDFGGANKTMNMVAPCPYNTLSSCQVCTTNCAMLTSTPAPRCGDGTPDAAFGEQCDGSVDTGHDTCGEFGLSPKAATPGLPKCTACNYDLSDCNPLPTCSNGVTDGGETGLDCGDQLGFTNNCKRCGVGQGCVDATDCDRAACNGSNVCEQTCSDGFKNEAETDVDCGGAECGKCATFKACTGATDCLSGICTSGVCRPGPTCGDGVKNQVSETCDGTDFGSLTCATETGGTKPFGTLTCNPACNNAGTGSCTVAPPTCGDGVKNQVSEQCDGTDFGGASCSSLMPGKVGNLSCSSCTISTAGCMTPAAVCPNGIVESGEQCDDNNGTTTDGCNACVVTNGFYCSGAPSFCMTICGDTKCAGTETNATCAMDCPP